MLDHPAPHPLPTAPNRTASEPPQTSTAALARLADAWQHTREALQQRIPLDAIAALARFALAATFWRSGQTKVEGLSIDFIEGHFTLGWPHLSENAVALFRDEYQLPLLPPELAATLAATGEHLLPLLLLAGLGTRFAALGLLCMTAVIQLFVFPGAYPTHGVWAAALLLLIARGPGRWSLDYLFGLERPPH
jgi:putative oxidoreductase